MSSGAPPSILPTSLEAVSLRDALARHRENLQSRLEAGTDGMDLGRANARFLNSCFRILFEGAVRRAGLPTGVALAAVGSFGRGAVALRSDADVVLVVDARILDVKNAGAIADGLLYPLWDASFTVGHQVLSDAEAMALAETDLATATALLDLKPLAGDETLLLRLIARSNEGLFGEHAIGAFFDRLEAEASARHGRFGDSIYLLEPDVKNGEGALRDLDGARWAARARYRVGQETGRDPLGVWGELMRLGVLLAREARELAHAEEFLWRIRNRLHARAGRKSDRLGFADQEALASSMGYGDDGARSVERLMQSFYLHALRITRTRTTMLERMRPSRARRKPAVRVDLGGGVLLFDGQVTIAGQIELERDPGLALRAFAACVRHQASLLPFARDSIARATYDAGWCERLRADREAMSLFVDLLCVVPWVPTRRGSMIGELYDTGLLLAVLPEFLPVVGRVQHDIYHVYTVDVHSVKAVDRVREMAQGALATQFPLASRLAAEVVRPRPLFLAALLHDIGKGWPEVAGPEDHSTAGAELCERILPRLGVTGDDAEETRQLVLDHLLMYRVATRRDLDDRSAVDEFCKRLRGRDSLRHLYLLTVADVSTTSPTAMTPWKSALLDELYFCAEARLVGQQDGAEEDRVARVREEVGRLWNGSADTLDGLLKTLPPRYVIANRPQAIAHHAQAISDRAGRAVHVARVPSRHPETVELCVVADDRPGLLASIAAALAANRLEVLKAEVYSHPVGAEREALDLFWVRDRYGGIEDVEDALPGLARDLDDVCSGKVSPAELLRSRTGSPWNQRRSPAVATEILFDHRGSPRQTIVEVFAKDRPGLLYGLACAFHELSLTITVSKINTEGSRVADVFYVSEADGSKVSTDARVQQIREALQHAVDGKTPA